MSTNNNQRKRQKEKMFKKKSGGILFKSTYQTITNLLKMDRDADCSRGEEGDKSTKLSRGRQCYMRRLPTIAC